MRKVLFLALFSLLGCYLKKEIAKPKSIVVVDDEIKALIHYSTDLFFDPNQLNPKDINKVNWIVSVMMENPNKRYSLEAHTNTFELKKDSIIGQRRLDVLKKLLTNKGVNAEQLVLIDYKDAYPIDTQNTEMSRDNNRRIEIIELKEKIIRIPSKELECHDCNIYAINILFNEHKIKPYNIEEIDNKVRMMKKYPNLDYSLEAHTDKFEIKKDSTLGKKRLEYVKGLFVEKGINPDRLHTSDSGVKYPIDTNKTKKGRSNNRRIEVKVKVK